MLVLATPLYYFGMTAQLKSIVDRFCSFNSSLHSAHLKSALLTVAWNDDSWTFEALRVHYQTLVKYCGFADQQTKAWFWARAAARPLWPSIAILYKMPTNWENVYRIQLNNLAKLRNQLTGFHLFAILQSHFGKLLPKWGWNHFRCKMAYKNGLYKYKYMHPLKKTPQKRNLAVIAYIAVLWRKSRNYATICSDYQDEIELQLWKGNLSPK